MKSALQICLPTVLITAEEVVRKREAFINQRFKELGIRMPSKR